MKNTVKSLNFGHVGKSKSTVNPAKKQPAAHSAKKQNFGNPKVTVGKSFKSIIK